MRADVGIHPPNIVKSILAYVIHEAVIGRCVPLEEFVEKVREVRALVKDDGRVMTSEVDRPPRSGGREKIDDPEIAESVCRDWKTVWKCWLVLEAAALPREIHEIGGSALETTDISEQLADLRRKRARKLLSKRVDLLRREPGVQFEFDGFAVLRGQLLLGGPANDLEWGHGRGPRPSNISGVQRRSEERSSSLRPLQRLVGQRIPIARSRCGSRALVCGQSDLAEAHASEVADTFERTGLHERAHAFGVEEVGHAGDRRFEFDHRGADDHCDLTKPSPSGRKQRGI